MGDIRNAMVAVDTMQASGVHVDHATWAAVMEGAQQLNHFKLLLAVRMHFILTCMQACIVGRRSRFVVEYD